MEIISVKIIKWTVAILLAAIAVLVPFKQLFFACGVLILLDTVTGLMRAYRVSEAMTSRSFSRLIEKFVGYGIGIIVGAILERYFVPEFPTARIIATAIATNEAMSIFENIKVVTGIDFWAVIRSKLLSSKEGDK